jgi:protein-S-isoprenylcysteine O-methyltransferase Ste14
MNLMEIANIVVGAVSLVSTLAIFIVVGLDFYKFQGKGGVKKEKKSIVDTATMAAFFLVYYLVIRFRIGEIATVFSPEVRIVMASIGCAIIIYSCYINVIGRRYLGGNWANHIRIYDDHELVREGPYKMVRHPLYASLIWMFFGGAMVYANYPALLLNLFIFMPFMYYRAKQEEEMLSSKFKQYDDYKSKVGMFFPKIRI